MSLESHITGTDSATPARSRIPDDIEGSHAVFPIAHLLLQKLFHLYEERTLNAPATFSLGRFTAINSVVWIRKCYSASLEALVVSHPSIW
jgi:hypothetical protein